jgi:hypothetical protein
MKINLEFTENTSENQKNLEYGAGYVVLFWDAQQQRKRIAIAIWRNGDFEYPTCRMCFKERPKLNSETIERENYISGWFRVQNWEE